MASKPKYQKISRDGNTLKFRVISTTGREEVCFYVLEEGETEDQLMSRVANHFEAQLTATTVIPPMQNPNPVKDADPRFT